jgi:hypothetical protein
MSALKVIVLSFEEIKTKLSALDIFSRSDWENAALAV